MHVCMRVCLHADAHTCTPLYDADEKDPHTLCIWRRICMFYVNIYIYIHIHVCIGQCPPTERAKLYARSFFQQVASALLVVVRLGVIWHRFLSQSQKMCQSPRAWYHSGRSNPTLIKVVWFADAWLSWLWSLGRKLEGPTANIAGSG